MNDGPLDPGLWNSRRGVILFFAALFAALAAARLCHFDVLWSDEDYHLAAAIQILHGRMLYRDLWYDKPPLTALFDVLFGARTGWILRVVSALFAAAVSALAFRFAEQVWSRREGYAAAALMAFFLIFYFPGATITLEPDTLMLAPHLAAVYLAWRGRAFAAGMMAGVAMLINVKALYILAACTLFFRLGAFPMLILGFAIPNAIGAAGMAAAGAWSGYLQQVWRWGLLYTASARSDGSGLVRALNWTGFHAALVLGALWAWSDPETPRARLFLWAVMSFLAAGVGSRYFPRYMDAMLPPLVIAGARGAVRLFERGGVRRALLALALALPIIRFEPNYVRLVREDLTGQRHQWTDLAMDLDSRDAAAIISKMAHPGDTIFVWGYRPDVIAYTRLPVASRFWDSQPLTGVPADRHLTSMRPIDAALAARNRVELARSHPSFIADGLSLYNGSLEIHGYPELIEWLAGYCEAARTRGTIIYRPCPAR